MLVDLLFLAGGFALLLGGGDALVRGASHIALRLSVPPLVIGLTVVAFGTSAPELAVNLIAAWGGNGDTSFGNIVGSNMANVGLIVGFTALVHALPIQGVLIRREIPMMLLGTAAAVIMGLDPLVRGEAPSFDRTDGLLLLLFFGVFVYYTVADVLHREVSDPLRQEVDTFRPKLDRGILLDAAMTVGGLAALVGGGRLTVLGAVGVAQTMGVPESVIGLTIVALGTSLPELVTALVATFRGAPDLAVGNIVGSNIFNLLFVLGLASSVTPIKVPAGGVGDLAVMTVLSVLLLPMAATNSRRIVPFEGAVLLVIYIGYLVWRFL